MSTRTKRVMFLTGGVTALLIIPLLVESAARRRAHGRLVDGTEVVLQRVSYGTNHTSPTAPLEGLLVHLPANWRRAIHWSPSSRRSNASSRPIFTFWLSFSSPAVVNQSISYAIADHNGFEAPMVFEGFYGPYTPGGFSTNVVGLARGTGNVPHRSGRFFLRLYQQTADGERIRVAEFPVTNVGLHTERGWAPEQLPIDQHTNGLTFSLVRAEVGVSPPGPLVAPYNLQGGQWSEFRFRVTEHAEPSAGWAINEIWVSDAAGNRLRCSAQDLGAFNGRFSRIEREEIVCLHRWEFWADEPAWQLTVHFERSTNTNGYWMDYLVRPGFAKLRKRPANSREQPASPNGGPARRLGSSAVGGRPPSVS
jgi:hypothetical protein